MEDGGLGMLQFRGWKRVGYNSATERTTILNGKGITSLAFASAEEIDKALCTTEWR